MLHICRDVGVLLFMCRLGRVLAACKTRPFLSWAAEEWLCWPCRLYEESQRAGGAPQSEIRPKRWEMEARGITHAELPGGSLAVGCCLCPVRQGAFKRTTDGKAWCHVVRAGSVAHGEGGMRARPGITTWP